MNARGEILRALRRDRSGFYSVAEISDSLELRRSVVRRALEALHARGKVTRITHFVGGGKVLFWGISPFYGSRRARGAWRSDRIKIIIPGDDIPF